MEERIVKAFVRAEELQSYKIKDIQEGKELVTEIEDVSKSTMQEMRGDGIKNDLHVQLTDLLYEYKKARNNIQNQMGRMVKERMKQEAEGNLHEDPSTV